MVQRVTETKIIDITEPYDTWCLRLIEDCPDRSRNEGLKRLASTSLSVRVRNCRSVALLSVPLTGVKGGPGHSQDSQTLHRAFPIHAHQRLPSRVTPSSVTASTTPLQSMAGQFTPMVKTLV